MVNAAARTALTWSGVFPLAHAFAAPLRAEPAAVQAGPLPLAQSFVEVAPSSLVVSAIKLPERGAGLIVRCWNTAETTVEGRVRLCWPFARAIMAPTPPTPGDGTPAGAARCSV